MTKPTHKHTILVVDDAPEIIDALTGILSADYIVKAANNGPKVLEIARSQRAPDLILLDIQMPDMDGYEVCRRLKADPATREIPVIFVTSLEAPTDEARGLRLGGVDFITKPLSPIVVQARVKTHLKLRDTTLRLKNLLSKTFLGSIQLMTDILSLANPLAFNQASRIKKYVRDMASHLGVEEVWRFETAALLSNIGCVALPLNILSKILRGNGVSEKELALYEAHPLVGRDLLAGIPGLEEVASMVFHQRDPYNPKFHKGPPAQWDPIRLGGHLLKIVMEFDRMTLSGEKPELAIAYMASQKQTYSPELVRVLEQVHTGMPPMVEQSVGISDLRPGMILMHDLVDDGKVKVAGGGCELTPESIRLIRRYNENNKLNEPIRVRVSIS